MLLLAVMPSSADVSHAVDALCTGTAVCCPNQCCPPPSSGASPSNTPSIRCAPSVEVVRMRRDVREAELEPSDPKLAAVFKPLAAVPPFAAESSSLPLHLRLQRLLI